MYYVIAQFALNFSLFFVSSGSPAQIYFRLNVIVDASKMTRNVEKSTAARSSCQLLDEMSVDVQWQSISRGASRLIIKSTTESRLAWFNSHRIPAFLRVAPN